MTPDDASDERVLAMLYQSMVNLGAPAGQARIMAAQMLKRARQVAAERGIAESAAMAELLAKVVAGRTGDYTGPSPSSPPGPDPR